jgi:hypothetical protein
MAQHPSYNMWGLSCIWKADRLRFRFAVLQKQFFVGSLIFRELGPSIIKGLRACPGRGFWAASLAVVRHQTR